MTTRPGYRPAIHTGVPEVGRSANVRRSLREFHNLRIRPGGYFVGEKPSEGTKDAEREWRGGFRPGLDPDRGDYASFAEFRDPDGNAWALQKRGYAGGL